MDADFLRDLFSQFRPVTVRRMFSGAGISADGVTFALYLRGALYLKGDETTAADFAREGCSPFSYTRSGSGRTVTVTSYWKMPERLYDDSEELAVWAARAFAVAQRAKAAPRRKRSAAKLKRPKAPKRN